MAAAEAESTSSSVHTARFWQYMAIRILLDILKASSLVLFEGAVMSIIKQHGGDIGLQKLFATFGGLIFGPIAGAMIDLSNEDVSNIYMSVILMFFGLRLAASLCLLKLSLDFKPPAKYFMKELGPALCKISVLMSLIAFFTAGLMWGFLETFLFWYLEDLGADHLLMGMSMAVATLTSLPLQFYSNFLIKKLKHERLVVLALVCFAVRMVGYSYIRQPAYFLFFEVLKPFSTTLLIITTFDFIRKSVPLTTYATVNSIFGASYFGVGRGLGGLVGGHATSALGFNLTFQVFAAASVVVAASYALVTGIDSRIKAAAGNRQRRGDGGANAGLPCASTSAA